MAITVNKNIIKRQAEKEKLIYWQIMAGTAELWRQDENIDFEESFQELEQALEELSEGARPGDTVTISMQNIPSSSTGRKTGQKIKRFNYTLIPTGSARGVSGVGPSTDYLKLVDKVARMEEAEKWRLMNEALEKRLEKLEKGDDKGISIQGILDHPMSNLVLNALFNGGAIPAQGAPVNGPAPDQSQDDINYLCANDPNFKKLLHAVRLIHQNEPGTYSMSSNMIIEQAKKYE